MTTAMITRALHNSTLTTTTTTKTQRRPIVVITKLTTLLTLCYQSSTYIQYVKGFNSVITTHYSTARTGYRALYSTTASEYEHGILAGHIMHNVNGLICREVTIDLTFGGDADNTDDDINGPMEVTVLEATADSQEFLVNIALGEEMADSGIDVASEDNNVRLSHEDPYGSVLWPAASAIARHLLDNVDNLNKLNILELGTGTGLVSIAAAKVGAKVLATDYEAVPLLLLDYAASKLNSNYIQVNGGSISTLLFDICDVNTPLPEANVLVAADIMYEPETGRAMARRVYEALQRGMRVLVGDSPGRAGRPAFLKELRTLLNDETVDFKDSMGTTCSGARHELICGKNSKSVSDGDTPKFLTIGILDMQPSFLKT